MTTSTVIAHDPTDANTLLLLLLLLIVLYYDCYWCIFFILYILSRPVALHQFWLHSNILTILLHAVV